MPFLEINFQEEVWEKLEQIQAELFLECKIKLRDTLIINFALWTALNNPKFKNMLVKRAYALKLYKKGSKIIEKHFHKEISADEAYIELSNIVNIANETYGDEYIKNYKIVINDIIEPKDKKSTSKKDLKELKRYFKTRIEYYLKIDTSKELNWLEIISQLLKFHHSELGVPF